MECPSPARLPHSVSGKYPRRSGEALGLSQDESWWKKRKGSQDRSRLDDGRVGAAPPSPGRDKAAAHALIVQASLLSPLRSRTLHPLTLSPPTARQYFPSSSFGVNPQRPLPFSAIFPQQPFCSKPSAPRLLKHGTKQEATEGWTCYNSVNIKLVDIHVVYKFDLGCK